MTPNLSKPPWKVFPKKQNYFCWVVFFSFVLMTLLNTIMQENFPGRLRQLSTPSISQLKKGPNFLLPKAARHSPVPSTPRFCAGLPPPDHDATWLPAFPHPSSDSGTFGTHIRLLQGSGAREIFLLGEAAHFLPTALLLKRMKKKRKEKKKTNYFLICKL